MMLRAAPAKASVMPWRGVVLLPLQDWPRKPGAWARRDLRNLPQHGSLGAATECWRRAGVLREAFGDGWRIVHKAGESAALVYAKHVWRTIETNHYPLHPAVSGGVSDSREIVEAVLQDRADPRVVLSALAVHLTPLRTPEARRRWDEGIRNVQRRVRANIDRDVPTIVLGDFNKRGRVLGKWINGCRVRYVSNGIDKVILIDSRTRKWNVRVGTRRVFNLMSDHHGLSARVRVRVTGRRQA